MTMPDRPLCRRCGWAPVYAHGLCKADHEYVRRTGRPRPPDRILAHLERRLAGKRR